MQKRGTIRLILTVKLVIFFYSRLGKLEQVPEIYQTTSKTDCLSLLRLIAFHIAPSNVPINFAVSMTSALLAGNSCVIRVSNKDFEQVNIVTEAINKVLAKTEFVSLQGYIITVRYERDKIVNDYLSSICDLRIVWGGDRKNTFNISTTSCFVIAGAGYKVAKHGNYAATSVSGASNVIHHHGVKFTADIDKLNRSINEAGIVYLHAQLFASAMKFVGPIRKALQFPTVFNLLGPLVNPSQPKAQLLGVANLDQMRLYRQVYQKLGIDYGIVNSIDGYDEISLTGDFKVATNNYERVFSPADLGFVPATPEELVGGANEDEAAEIFDAVLEDRALPAQKNVVLANAAFGIQIMERQFADA